jgi:DNA-binding response OmpR family regulator
MISSLNKFVKTVKVVSFFIIFNNSFCGSMAKKKTILIIDDSNTTLILLDWSLKEEGYDTQIALNVEEAKQYITKAKPDLILLDLFMPEVSGYDFLKMKPALNIKDVPVIVVSAYNNQESVMLVRELGAAEFISKPFSIDAIVEAVKKHI